MPPALHDFRFLRDERRHWVAACLVALLAGAACSRPSFLQLAHSDVGAPLQRARGVVMLLHGYGAPADDLLGLARKLHAAGRQDTAFVVVEGPHGAGAGRAWFKQQAQVADTRNRLHRLLLGVMKTARLQASRVVIGGFSQGAMVAADVALHEPTPLGGVLMLSGTEMPGQGWDQAAPGHRGTRFFISHGVSDSVIPQPQGLAVRDLFEKAGVPVTFVGFPGGHAIPPAVEQALPGFLAGVFDGG